MVQYIEKSAVVAKIEERIKETESMRPMFDQFWAGQISAFEGMLKILDTLKVKESDETAEAFARIIRANLTGIDKDVQYKFEQLYKEITGEKMYQGYND